MKTKISRETCIACGNCYAICPEVYDCDEDGVAFCHLDNNEMDIIIDSDLESSVRDCVDCCPTESVIIDES